MKFSLIYPYYNNPSMLNKQIDEWNSYSDEIKSMIEIVLVDDASQESPAFPIFTRLDCSKKLFRVKKDIPWNNHCARNIGCHEALGEWIFVSDIDIVLPQSETYKLFINKELNLDLFYRFNRKFMPSLTISKKHRNTFLITKFNFWKTNGYDEDYCGTYGGEQQLFDHLLELNINEEYLEDIVLHGYDDQIEKQDIEDANSKLGRKDSIFNEMKRQVNRRKFYRARSSNPLRSEYERLI